MPAVAQHLGTSAIFEPETCRSSAATACDETALQRVVRVYRAKRLAVRKPQAIESIRTIYYRTMVAGGASVTFADTNVANFSQQVTTSLVSNTATRDERGKQITQ